MVAYLYLYSFSCSLYKVRQRESTSGDISGILGTLSTSGLERKRFVEPRGSRVQSSPELQHEWQRWLGSSRVDPEREGGVQCCDKTNLPLVRTLAAGERRGYGWQCSRLGSRRAGKSLPSGASTNEITNRISGKTNFCNYL